MTEHGMNCRASTQIKLFDNLPLATPKPRKPGLDEVRVPRWTADKSSLIDEYIHRFLLVTRHGVYLDLFAGPQRVNNLENWSVRKVLDRRTEGNPAIRRYAVCDNDPKKIPHLRDLGSRHGNVSFRIYEGDANTLVRRMLQEARIGPNTACFCLIDQRTFECQWTTVELIARYKRGRFKIELFYFLAQAWIDRARRSYKYPENLEKWWGGSDYEEEFFKLRSFERAEALCRRFRDELNYTYASPFSIHRQGRGSRVMYYMIHASDHPKACSLMAQAYRKIESGERSGDQLLLPERA